MIAEKALRFLLANWCWDPPFGTCFFGIVRLDKLFYLKKFRMYGIVSSGNTKKEIEAEAVVALPLLSDM